MRCFCNKEILDPNSDVCAECDTEITKAFAEFEVKKVPMEENTEEETYVLPDESEIIEIETTMQQVWFE